MTDPAAHTLPHYPGINSFVLKAILFRLLRRKRSARADSKVLCRQLQPSIHYFGLEYLPTSGPLLVTVNHYSRPGFSTAWIAMSISAVLPADPAWIISNQWLFEGNPLAFVLRPLMRFVLRCITLTYDFIPMPTMVPGFSTPQERAAGVRQTIERVRRQPDLILGLTPEGMDMPEGQLGLPPAGAGRFICHLNQMGLPILPTGVCEKDGCLQVHFGQCYQLDQESAGTRDDLTIRKLVMENIRPLIN